MGDIDDVGDAVADELTFDPDVDAAGITVRAGRHLRPPRPRGVLLAPCGRVLDQGPGGPR